MSWWTLHILSHVFFSSGMPLREGNRNRRQSLALMRQLRNRLRRCRHRTKSTWGFRKLLDLRLVQSGGVERRSTAPSNSAKQRSPENPNQKSSAGELGHVPEPSPGISPDLGRPEFATKREKLLAHERLDRARVERAPPFCERLEMHGRRYE
jgi:hypothetical protein